MTKLRLGMIGLAALLIMSVGLLLKVALTPVVPEPAGFPFSVPEGASLETVTRDLVAQHVITEPRFFKWLFWAQATNHDLKAGEYIFPKGSTPFSIIRQLVTGKGKTYRTFTIIAGWTFSDVRASLARDESIKHTIQAKTDIEIMTALGLPNQSPEGYFFPDTYFFVRGTSDMVLLKRAYDAMQKKLAENWALRDQDLMYQTSYQALIAASMIEKETSLPSERPLIAGVLVNRLSKNMLLQFDPTVIYGLGDKYQGKLYKKNLKDRSPYNTYMNKGLPPTPIAMPSLESIRAALHPEKTNYLYFVAKGDGSHQFSENLKEHYSAVTTAKEFKSEFFNSMSVKNYLRKNITIEGSL